MAFSQLLCLDNNHENPRINEFKPEFLYCEDQRLALEALLQDGREGYLKILEARGLRGFLSDPELEALGSSVEPYDPDMELFPENVEDDESPVSLQYWPELSDMSIPQMDLSWPDCESYRGVTRTTAYSQPPMEGQPHIKEVVRKMIAQAQKVIAVVMDVFTDVDIFRDLLDAGFKRKVSVYILLEHTTLPHFLSMCQRANMHSGHLKHLRVRTTGGLDFYTRSSSRVHGRMGHRFMFIDGDKAVSGSYSFTWTSSRMDRNLITAVTGQAVDAFDRLFRILYQTSRLVDLRKVATGPEPEPEYLPQPLIVAPLSAALARKMYNPKYALVLGDATNCREPSAVKSNPKKTDSQEDTKTKKRRGATKEATEKDPPIHPGLNLEKACLMFYLPTWPEPDPPSDVIGFINIRDPNRPNQVHLQRHEMFEISQAIRFSSPISIPKEILPEVAKPRQVGRKCEEINKLQPSPNKTKAQVSVVERAQPAEQNKPAADIKMKAEAPEQISPASGKTCEADNYTNRPENTDNKLHPSRHTNTTAVLNTHPTPQSSKASTPDNPVLNPLPGSTTKTSSNTQETQLSPPVDSNTEQTTQTKTQPKCTDSHTQPQNLKMTPNIQIPNDKSHMSPSSTSTICSQSVCSTSLYENNLVSISASMTTSVPLSPNSPPLTSSSTLSSHIPLSSPLTSARPIPKPRTVQLVIKGDVTSNGQKVPEFSIIKRSQTSTAPMSRVEPAAAETQPETVREVNNNDGTKAGELKDSDIIRNIEEAPQQKISQEAKNEEIVGLQVGRAEMHLLARTNLDTLSDGLTCDAPEAEGVNIQEIIPKDFEPTDCKSAPLFTPTVQTGTNATDGTPAGLLFAEDPNEKNVQNAEELNSNSNSEKTEKDIDALDTVNSCHTQTQVPKDTAGDCTHTPDAHKTMQGHPSFTRRTCTDSLPNATIHYAHNTDTPEKNLCLNFSGKNMSDLSVSPELLPALGRTPTPEGFLSHTLCPDSQIQRTAPLSNNSDLQSPTSDLSDENVSLRTDSALSTTSEEYFECSDSPLQESVLCRAALCNHLMKEDQVGFTHSNSTTLITIPTFIGYNPFAATSVFSDSCSLSSNEVYGKEVDEKSSSDTEVDSLGSQRRDRLEVTGVADHFKEVEKLTDAADKNKEVQLEAPERKTVPNKSAERCVDGQVTPNQSRNEEEDPKQLCAEDPKPHKEPPVGARPDKRKAADKGDTKSSGLEKRGRRLSSAETDGKKPSPPPVRPLRQQEGGTSSPSRPRRPSRPLSGDGPAGGGQLNQTETKERCSGLQVLDNSSSTRKPPARPPPPVAAGNAGSAGSRKPVETPSSRQNLQCRVKAVHSTNQHPNPRPQTPNMLRKLHPHPQIQTVSAQVAPCQEEEKSPLNFSLSRLYSLKSLKDKIVKVPVASKRDSSSSAAQRHKSTS